MSKDYTGQTFGKLKCVSPSNKRLKSGAIMWDCVCATCGKINTRVPSQLRRTVNKGEQTICLHCDRGTYKEALRKGVRWNYQRNARTRNLEFRLSETEFYRLIDSSCHYCGSLPANKQRHVDCPGEVLLYQGIDRIDNDLDYVAFNCIPCCGACNRAKDTRDYMEYISWIKDISKNLGL